MSNRPGRSSAGRNSRDAPYSRRRRSRSDENSNFNPPRLAIPYNINDGNSGSFSSSDEDDILTHHDSRLPPTQTNNSGYSDQRGPNGHSRYPIQYNRRQQPLRQQQRFPNTSHDISNGQHDISWSPSPDMTDTNTDRGSIVAHHGSVLTESAPEHHRSEHFTLHPGNRPPRNTRRREVTISPIDNFTNAERPRDRFREENYRSRSRAFLADFDTAFGASIPPEDDDDTYIPRGSSHQSSRR